MMHRPTPTGATAVVGVIGDPIRHSLSPALHNAAFDALGLDWVSAAFPVSEGAGRDAVAAMRTLGIRGLSVTMPHKQVVAEAADHRSPEVEILGVANCLVLGDDGAVTAHNTDGAGFVAGLQLGLGRSLEGASVAVIGAGGAARAVVDACSRAGAASVAVVNRTEENARQAAALAGQAGHVGGAEHIEAADVVVNATSVGMGTDTAMPCPAELLSASQTVVDLIYDPWQTRWLEATERRVLAAQNGFPMLLHQAAIQISLWTGREAPVEAMETAARREINPT